jgi:molybdopterin molybdotransferase
MTTTARRNAAYPGAARLGDLTPLAEYLAAALRGLRPLPPLDVDLTRAHGNILADDVVAPGPLPAFDYAAIDGYAARTDEVSAATPSRPVRLNVIGDLGSASWRPTRLTQGSCFAIAAGAPLPVGTDVVIPLADTDLGMAAVEVRVSRKKGYGLRRAGDEVAAGAMLALAGSVVTPAVVALLAATGVGHVLVRPSPRVVVIATGDELVDVGRASAPGQLVDVNSHALVAASVEAGAHGYRVGICDDDPEALRGLMDDQALRADLMITTGGTGTGPGDMVRRIMSRSGVLFTDVAAYPCSSLGYGVLTGTDVPVVCLPGDPGAALVGFELLARPVISVLAGAEPVFRHNARAHLLETVDSPAGLREFRPGLVSERRGGGYTVAPLPGGPYTLSGLAAANGLIVLGERVTAAPAGSTVDVLLLDRRR